MEYVKLSETIDKTLNKLLNYDVEIIDSAKHMLQFVDTLYGKNIIAMNKKRWEVLERRIEDRSLGKIMKKLTFPIFL